MARTVINLDDKLVKEAMRLTGLKRKVDVVNQGLKALVKQRRWERKFRKIAGTIEFDVDPYEMRHGVPRPR
jgi:Arc/MetJ family transcription regulator